MPVNVTTFPPDKVSVVVYVCKDVRVGWDGRES